MLSFAASMPANPLNPAALCVPPLQAKWHQWGFLFSVLSRTTLPVHTTSQLDCFSLQAKWYQWGFLFSVLYLSVWVFVGGAWWKAIGIF